MLFLRSRSKDRSLRQLLQMNWIVPTAVGDLSRQIEDSADFSTLRTWISSQRANIRRAQKMAKEV
jgi:hypothetical protein